MHNYQKLLGHFVTPAFILWLDGFW